MASKRRLLLLDYDGTLVPLEKFPPLATPSIRLKELLLKLINDIQTDLFIVTGRAKHDIDKFLGQMPVNVIAEHGAFIKQNGIWINQIKDDGLWKNDILDLFNKRTLVCLNSFVEEKQYSLAWHYRNVEEDVGERHSNELIFSLLQLPEFSKLRIIKGDKVIEAMTTLTNKGVAVKNVAESNAYDCIICIGDDRTDEDMFSYLLNNDNAVTIKVGTGNTLAKHRLDDVNQVIIFLEKISK